jgi:hypothetical protein
MFLGKKGGEISKIMNLTSEFESQTNKISEQYKCDDKKESNWKDKEDDNNNRDYRKKEFDNNRDFSKSESNNKKEIIDKRGFYNRKQNNKKKHNNNRNNNNDNKRRNDYQDQMDAIKKQRLPYEDWKKAISNLNEKQYNDTKDSMDKNYTFNKNKQHTRNLIILQNINNKNENVKTDFGNMIKGENEVKNENNLIKEDERVLLLIIIIRY